MGYVWVDDEDDTPEEVVPQESNSIKNLREQYEAEKKARAELEKKLGEFSKANRERSIKDTLNGFGVPPKVAALIPDSVDASEEAVGKWLGDYADVFGLKFEQAPATPAAAPDQQTVNAFQRAQAVERTSQQAPQSGNDAALAQIVNATSEAELLAFLAGAQR